MGYSNDRDITKALQHTLEIEKIDATLLVVGDWTASYVESAPRTVLDYCDIIVASKLFKLDNRLGNGLVLILPDKMICDAVVCQLT